MAVNRRNRKTAVRANDNASKHADYAIYFGAQAGSSTPETQPAGVVEDSQNASRQSPDDNNGLTHASTLIIHKPQAPEDALAIRTVTAIESEGAGDSWYHILPSYLGHSVVGDACTKALVATSDHVRGIPGIALEECYRLLSTALMTLRTAMANPGTALLDDSLMAIATLAPAEAVLSGNSLLTPSHLQGIMAVISSRPAKWQVSDITRSIVDYCYTDSFVMATIKNEVSPLEPLNRVVYETFDDDHSDRKLRAMGNELSIRLPRLISYTRGMRRQVADATTKATRFAITLLKQKDDAAENEVLHHVKIVTTRGPADAKMTKVSFSFESNQDYEAATRYWQTRLALLRVCWRLPESQHIPPKVRLQAEMRRLSSNLIMAAQQGRTYRVRGRRRLFALSMIMLWGMLNDAPNALSETIVLSEARTWLRTSANNILGGQFTLTDHDMDDAAELFVGGPSKGIYVELHGRPEKHNEGIESLRFDEVKTDASGERNRRASVAHRKRLLLPAG